MSYNCGFGFTILIHYHLQYLEPQVPRSHVGLHTFSQHIVDSHARDLKLHLTSAEQLAVSLLIVAQILEEHTAPIFKEE
jgi:hypothetical protein